MVELTSEIKAAFIMFLLSMNTVQKLILVAFSFSFSSGNIAKENYMENCFADGLRRTGFYHRSKSSVLEKQFRICSLMPAVICTSPVIFCYCIRSL